MLAPTRRNGGSIIVAVLLGLFACAPAAGQVLVNAQLPWHAAELDSQGKLLAWYMPDKNRGYDHVLRRGLAMRCFTR